jgi:hypothetical protein
MKLEQPFYSLQERNPYWSSYTCLANAVIGKKYLKTEIRLAFRKLVYRDDYAKSESEQIIAHLISLSKPTLTKNDIVDTKSPINTGVYEMEVA